MDCLSSASGIIAVVSIALQLGESIKQLVEFGKAVQDAPAHICALFDDLEQLDAVIGLIQPLNGHAALDNVKEKALLNCQQKISTLQNTIHHAQLHLKSNSLVRQKWSAFKIVLKKNEILSIQKSIEEAKTTLQLILVLSIGYRQEQAIAVINAITPLTQHSSFVTHIMQSTNNLNALSNTQPVRAPLHGSSDISMGDISPATVFGAGETVIPFRRPARPFDVRMRNAKSLNERSLHTPFFTISARSRTSKVRITQASEVYETSEADLSAIFYPKAAGRFLGVASGVHVSANSTSGWKYTIQPFRPVDETALIFDFCRCGNLAGVKALFSRNEASSWDRDPTGRTPLIVAAQFLQLDVARFLLEAGADPHATCWNKPDEPICTVTLSPTVNIQPKLNMINLLQEHRREEYDDLAIGNIIGHMLFLYRPQRDISITWTQRQAAILKLFWTLMPFFDSYNPYRADIIHFAVKLCYEQEVLQYLLRTTKGCIEHRPSASSTIHEALHRRLLHRDLSSMKLIVEKTKNLHRPEIKYYQCAESETPTMLAMYDMRTFHAWRDLLHDMGYESKEFVGQELHEGLIQTDGWAEASLVDLFETKSLPEPFHGPMFFGFMNCERCGDDGTKVSRRLKVDLIWRRYLRDIRLKHSTQRQPEEGVTSASTGAIPPSRKDDPEILSQIQDAPSTQRRELPYRIVCADACQDGLCVAWVYENNTNLEPDLPPYPCGSLPKSKDEEQGNAVTAIFGEDSCPTQSMPGAFKP